MISKNCFTVLFFSLLLAAFSSCNSEPKDSEERATEMNEEKLEDTDIENDAKFAVEALLGGMTEIRLGELAKTRGITQSAKDLGAKMAMQHKALNEELISLANKKNISVPKMMSQDGQNQVIQVREYDGKEFDKAYFEFLVDHHEKSIEMYKDEADFGNDPEIKAWAAKNVEALKQHLELARQANSEMDAMK